MPGFSKALAADLQANADMSIALRFARLLNEARILLDLVRHGQPLQNIELIEAIDRLEGRCREQVGPIIKGPAIVDKELSEEKRREFVKTWSDMFSGVWPGRKLSDLPQAGTPSETIEVVDGQPSIKNAVRLANNTAAPAIEDRDETINRVCRGVASIQEGEKLRQYIAALEAQNAALYNLANHAQPGPISEALAATLHVATWRQRAAHWLRQEACKQELTNQQYPAHAAEYRSWRVRPYLLRMWADTLAGKLEAAQCSDPPGTWLLYFEDPDHGHEVYTGDGADDAAFRRYQAARMQWSCHLFVRVEGADRTPPTWQGNRLFWAVRQLLDGLPKQRDWLNPSIERELREYVGKPAA